MYEANNPASDRVVDYVRKHLPANIVFDVLIPRTVATADAFAAGQPVAVRPPADAAAQAYVNLATILADRLRRVSEPAGREHSVVATVRIGIVAEGSHRRDCALFRTP